MLLACIRNYMQQKFAYRTVFQSTCSAQASKPVAAIAPVPKVISHNTRHGKMHNQANRHVATSMPGMWQPPKPAYMPQTARTKLLQYIAGKPIMHYLGFLQTQGLRLQGALQIHVSMTTATSAVHHPPAVRGQKKATGAEHAGRTPGPKSTET